MEYVIDRSKWRCGGSGSYHRGEGETLLLNADGFLCCLGQVSEQCGVPRSNILDHFIPEGIKDNHAIRGILVDTETQNDNELSNTAMDINDDDELVDSVREARLTALFTHHRHTITFTGDYVMPNAD